MKNDSIGKIIEEKLEIDYEKRYDDISDKTFNLEDLQKAEQIAKFKKAEKEKEENFHKGKDSINII